MFMLNPFAFTISCLAYFLKSKNTIKLTHKLIKNYLCFLLVCPPNLESLINFFTLESLLFPLGERPPPLLLLFLDTLCPFDLLFFFFTIFFVL